MTTWITFIGHETESYKDGFQACYLLSTVLIINRQRGSIFPLQLTTASQEIPSQREFSLKQIC